MHKASPVELRTSIEMAHSLAQIGVRFVPIPVETDEEFHTLATSLSQKLEMKWSTKTGHRVRVFSSIDFPIRLVVTHHYIRAVLVRCNIQRYSPLLRELHR